ncbi:DUF934 domain-containing protein [Roseibium suaedae]|uniref:Uncharacterized conserved protein, DUF934 family n=1 Tax=Roseibium suaedae TaxID=735517 RepID=A0A1M7AE56_9HYPH|nr:DUF934 domain-containing protein [Roseibium suaedae]SHL41008.1 Uncharacterized conserved protein, DUF934 family [Roseibium suaedae]
MSKIYKNGAFHEEDWIRVASEEPVPASGNVLVPLARYLAEAESLSGSDASIAVLVSPGDNVEDIVAHLDKLALVAVDFPKFSDGRGFSSARVLREEFGYKGDIRAVGFYILDQIPLLRRCGVSSFEIVKPEVLAALEKGEWPEVTRYLQPVGAVEEAPAGTRPWARLSLRSSTAEAAE